MLPLFNDIKKNKIISWNILSLKEYMCLKKGESNNISLKKLIKDFNYFPSLMTLNILNSNKNIKKNVLKYYLKKNINFKNNVLFLQLHKNNKGKLGLFINNKKEILSWLLIENKSITTYCKILLEEISKIIKRPTLIILDKKLSEIENLNLKIDSLEICNALFYEEHVYSKIKNNRLSVLKDTYLKELENESIQIIREVVANSQKPVMLYSIGKDSSVLLHLAQKAFYPGDVPFPLLHVDTTWKFRSMYKFRDIIKNQLETELIIYTNEEGIKKGINPLDYSSDIHTDIMKTQALKKALNKYKFDFIIAGARRDEEKSRAKERIFSFRDANHKWNPKKQRPEVWDLYNTKLKPNQSIRVFPLSNWTELDIWHYIKLEKIPIVDLYFSKNRLVVKKNNSLLMIDDERLKLTKRDTVEIKKIRFRTLGCYPLTGAVVSDAKNIDEIIEELSNSNLSERMGRLIDNDQSNSMEMKKIEGYF